jgi:glycosyltransferase involved in cell wall biosynthesis
MLADPPVAVIIPAWRAWSTLDRVLDSLESQLHPGDEAVLVESSADGRAAALRASRPWLNVIEMPTRTPPGAARNIGVEATNAPLVAFVDADAVPDPQWLDCLRASLGASTAVGGCIRNGTPSSLTGTAGYLLEFSEWLPGRRQPTPDTLASCSLLIRRTSYVTAGGMAADCWPGEDTLLTFPLGRRGELQFSAHSGVTHLNRTGLMTFLRHQVRLGRSFATVCQRSAFEPRWLGSRWLAPLAAPARLISLSRRLSGQPELARQALMAAPLIVIGLCAWSVGVVRGSAT